MDRRLWTGVDDRLTMARKSGAVEGAGFVEVACVKEIDAGGYRTSGRRRGNKRDAVARELVACQPKAGYALPNLGSPTGSSASETFPSSYCNTAPGGTRGDP